MGFARFLVLPFLLATELMIIGALFSAVRLNTSLGITSSLILTSCALMGLITLKLDFDIAINLSEESISFKNLVNLERPRSSAEERRFLKSCRIIEVDVGGMFTITRQSFPSIVQDIILANLINLLLMY